MKNIVKCITSKKQFYIKVGIGSVALLSTFMGINYATNIGKGELNDDSKVDYEDVRILEEHLIHSKTLPNNKKNNADMNNDGEITVTDLSILLDWVEDTRKYEVRIEDINTENYYPNKNEEIEVKFISNANYEDIYVEAVIVNNELYEVEGTKTARSENTIKINVGNQSGIKEYHFTKAILNNGREVEIDNKLTISVLKNKPFIDEKSYEVEQKADGKAYVSFNLIDEDNSIVSAQFSVYEKVGEDKKGSPIVTSNIAAGIHKREVPVENNKTYQVEIEMICKLATEQLPEPKYENETIMYTRKFSLPIGSSQEDPENSEIYYTKPVWKNGKASIKLLTIAKFNLQYQKNRTDGAWIDIKSGEKVTELNNSDIVYARLWDGTKTIGNLKIKIQDEIAPTIEFNSVTKTSNSINIKVIGNDAESGLATNNTYTYYIKESNDTDYEIKSAGIENDYTFTNLKQKTEYNVKVVVRDEAGNEEEGLLNVTTDKVGGEEGKIVSTVVWYNKKAILTLSTESSLKIQYRKGGTSDWIEGTIINDLEHGDKVYVRLIDGTNAGDEEEILIEDTKAPNITITKGTITTNSATITADATDAESGLADTNTYTYAIKKADESNYRNVYTGVDSSYIYRNLTQNTDYDIKITVRDVAGNTEETTTTIKTNAILGVILDNTIWNNSKATLNLTTTSGYNIEWQKNSNSGMWSKGNTISNLNLNDVVWVRLSDGVSEGEERKIIITDSYAPRATITINGDTFRKESTITATVEHRDNESGIVPENCRWVFDENQGEIGTDESLYTGGNFKSDIQDITFSEMDAGIYYLHILSVDRAGNKTETISNSITIREIVLSDLKSGDYIQYNANGWSSWRILYEQGEKVTDLSGNTVALPNMQIVATQTTSLLRLNWSNYGQARTVINGLNETLQGKANEFINEFAVGARSFGAIPINPTYDSELTEINGVSVKDSWSSIAQQITETEVKRAFDRGFIKRYGELGSGYRKDVVITPCRILTEGNEVGFKEWPLTQHFTSDKKYNIATSNPDSAAFNSTVDYGFLPVVILKDNLKITGGTGTDINPWKIEI